jgi:hypothetical protein
MVLELASPYVPVVAVIAVWFLVRPVLRAIHPRPLAARAVRRR